MYNKKFRWNSLLQKTVGLDHTAEKEELCRWSDPPQAENPAQQDSFLCAEMAGDVSVNFI